MAYHRKQKKKIQKLHGSNTKQLKTTAKHLKQLEAAEITEKVKQKSRSYAKSWPQIELQA